RPSSADSSMGCIMVVTSARGRSQRKRFIQYPRKETIGLCFILRSLSAGEGIGRCPKGVASLWHGLPIVPPGATEGLHKRQETCGRASWHGRETVPQPVGTASSRRRGPIPPTGRDRRSP